MQIKNESKFIRRILGDSPIPKNSWAQILLEYCGEGPELVEHDAVLDKFLVLLKWTDLTRHEALRKFAKETLIEADNEESIRMRFRMLMVAHFLKVYPSALKLDPSPKLKDFLVDSCGGVIFEFVEFDPMIMRDSNRPNGLLTPMLNKVESKIISNLEDCGARNTSEYNKIAIIDLTHQAMAWIRPMKVWHSWAQSESSRIWEFGYSGLLLCTSSLDSNQIQYDLSLFGGIEKECVGLLTEDALKVKIS